MGVIHLAYVRHRSVPISAGSGRFTKPSLMPKIEIRGNLPLKIQTLPMLSPNSLQTYKPMERHFTLLRIPISEVFNTIKSQPWVRRPSPIRYDSTFPKQKNFVPIVTARDTKPSTAGPSGSTWKISSNKTFSKSTSSLSKQPPDPDSLTLHRFPSYNT